MLRAVISFLECLPANLEKSLKWGATQRQIGCTSSEGKTYNRVTTGPLSGENSSNGVRRPSEGNLNSRVGFMVAFKWRFCPISGAMNLIRPKVRVRPIHILDASTPRGVGHPQQNNDLI